MKTDLSFEEKFIYLDKIFVDEKLLSPEINEHLSTKQSGTSISHLNPEITNQFAKTLGLVYVSSKEPDGNLCFANNDEVRSEFKLTFTSKDIINYIAAVLHAPIFTAQQQKFLKTNSSIIPYPKDPEIFWELVEIGSKMRSIIG